MNFDYRSKPGRKKTRNDDDKCLVCGERADGTNFGVQTCSPCKAFFRRNAVKLGTTEFECQGDGDCPVTSNTRRQCNCCRLAKCFYVGMNRNAIRSEDQRQQRRELIEFNRQKRAENKHIMIRSPNLLNYKSSYLSSSDQTILTNIFGAYEQTCVALKHRQYLNISSDDTFSLQKFMNSCSHMYMALIEYLKFVPDFADLSINSKKLLVKNNLNQLFRLNSALVVKATGIIDDPNSSVFVRLFPRDLFEESCKCIAALFSFLYDPILMKLLLIVLMFSTHMNIQYENHLIETDDENNTRKIFIAQNVYAELLWRYIISRCSDYRQAVKLFSSFISRLIYSQYVSTRITEYVSSITSNQTDHLEPIIRVLFLNNKN